MVAANSLNISQTGFVYFDGVSTFTGKTIQTANSTVPFTLASTTLTQDFGRSNLALGSSLPSLSSGSANVALGQNALNAVTSGSGNTVIGTSSGGGITTSSFNTVVGQGSLESNNA